MGYFPNGTAGMDYEERYCSRCVHGPGESDEGMCAVWMAHMLLNYDESDKKDSVLHMLIPRSKNGLGNEQCTMFVPRQIGGAEGKALAEQTWDAPMERRKT